MSEAAEPLTAVWGGWSLRVASDGAAEFVETDTGAVAARGALHPLGGSDAKLHSLRLEPVADGLPFDLAPPAWWPEFAAEWPVWIDREAGCVRVGEPSADPARACLWRIDGAEASAEAPLSADVVGCWSRSAYSDADVEAVVDPTESSGFSTQGEPSHSQESLVVWADGGVLELHESSRRGQLTSRTAAAWLRPGATPAEFALAERPEELSGPVPPGFEVWFLGRGEQTTGRLRRAGSALTLLPQDDAAADDDDGSYWRSAMGWAPPKEVREAREAAVRAEEEARLQQARREHAAASASDERADIIRGCVFWLVIFALGAYFLS